jgi:hypothetical protein
LATSAAAVALTSGRPVTFLAAVALTSGRPVTFLAAVALIPRRPVTLLASIAIISGRPVIFLAPIAIIPGGPVPFLAPVLARAFSVASAAFSARPAVASLGAITPAGSFFGQILCVKADLYMARAEA